MISAKTQESDVQQIIATLREESPDWQLVWVTLLRLERHEYRDIYAVWAYASEHAKRTIAELDGGQEVLDVWAAEYRICLYCWRNMTSRSYWFDPLRSIVEYEPSFRILGDPRPTANIWRCTKGSTCSTGYDAVEQVEFLCSQARRGPDKQDDEASCHTNPKTSQSPNNL